MDNLSKRLSLAVSRVMELEPCDRTGRLVGATGSTQTATLPGARMGELVNIGRQGLPALVVGFDGTRAILSSMARGVSLVRGMSVHATGIPARLGWSSRWLGRVLSPLGQALDGRPLPPAEMTLPLDASAPHPLRRKPIEQVLRTGIKVVDGLLTLGHGQRIGLFAGAGVGKSTLLGQMAAGAQADCIVVCMVGERGREVQEFLHHSLGAKSMKRSVAVVATSDEPAGVRAMALPTATTLAEGFRAKGARVLLLVDSLTRHARALRERALGAGEPPGRRGFPSSVFDHIASLLERAGNDHSGSITAIYTVLTEDRDEDDPVAQEVRGLLDGHIILSPALAMQGCFPSVDPARSISRVMSSLVDGTQLSRAAEFRKLWSAYEERRDLIAAGAYEQGTEPLTDRALASHGAMLDFIRQGVSEPFFSGDIGKELLRALGGEEPG